MIEEFSDRFIRDYKKLKREHQILFSEARGAVIDALKAHESGKKFVLPGKFRLKQLKKSDGILALTWSFRSPDGRATFLLSEESGHQVLTWLRVGTHEIFT